MYCKPTPTQSIVIKLLLTNFAFCRRINTRFRTDTYEDLRARSLGAIFFIQSLYRASFGVLVGTKTSSNRAIDDKVLAIRKKLSYNSQAFGKKSSITATERCPSWPKEHDWKSCVRHKRTVGSNPTLSAKPRIRAHLTPFLHVSGLGHLRFGKLHQPPSES